MGSFEQKSFLESSFPSSTFLPAICCDGRKMHAWADRGIIDLPETGQGQKLYLYGDDILFLRCLVISSNAGLAPKAGIRRASRPAIRGLEQCIKRFSQNVIDDYEQDKPSGEIFAVYRIAGESGGIDGEWQLAYSRHEILQAPHIVENGVKAAPFWAVLSLSAILDDVQKKVWAAL